MQNPKLRRLWPRRYRRSDVYRKLVAYDQKHGLTAVLAEKRHQPPREMVVQDVEIPVGRGDEFLGFFEKNVKMTPVWMCPLRLRGDRTWTLYPMHPGDVYVNFGFWGTVPLPPGQRDGYYNRMVEDGSQRARRAQVAVLLRLLLRGRIPPQVQRCGVRQAQGRV